MKPEHEKHAREVRKIAELWITLMEENRDLKEAGLQWIEAFDLASTIDETTRPERIGHIASQGNKATADLEAVFRRILSLDEKPVEPPPES